MEALRSSDVRVISETRISVDVTDIWKKSLSNIPICAAGAVIQTNQVPIICLFSQYLNYGKVQGFT
jgi:hypothetical protein